MSHSALFLVPDTLAGRQQKLAIPIDYSEYLSDTYWTKLEQSSGALKF